MSSIGIGMSSPCSDSEHSSLGAMLDIILPRSPCQHPQDNITHSWFCKQSQCHWDREWTRMYLMNCACRGFLLNLATRPCRTSLSKMLPKRIHPLCVCVCLCGSLLAVLDHTSCPGQKVKAGLHYTKKWLSTNCSGENCCTPLWAKDSFLQKLNTRYSPEHSAVLYTPNRRGHRLIKKRKLYPSIEYVFDSQNKENKYTDLRRA